MSRRHSPLLLAVALLLALPVPAAWAADPSAASPAPDAAAAAGDPWIVLLRPGTDVEAAAKRAQARTGAAVGRRFRHAVRAFAADLTQGQRRQLASDPAVVAIVPDERIEKVAQVVPTGVSRVGGRVAPLAGIDGVDDRVDADVAIVDTGIDGTHADLNVAGGYNCSTSDSTAWRDVDAHGTHVAGTVGALDNGIGVVGVAPGVRLWAVKILNDEGYGRLSWYVCGLDWIAAQRDPSDPSRPLFESVNMSVAKSGRDDRNCGFGNDDILHQAICRVVAAGITVVAAAANDSTNAAYFVPAAYNEVITVSALADTDGKPGGLGGNACYSWGTYDTDDTFANFSNYGADVDLIAPGKCIWSTLPGNRYGNSSGTSMAAPHVAGAVALYKASRPDATPAEVRAGLIYLGSTDWRQSTDPDSLHERLLRVERIGPLGDFDLAVGEPDGPVGEAGGTVSLPLTLTRTETFFERVGFTIAEIDAPLTASLPATSLMGFTANAATIDVTVPRGTPNGTYRVVVRAANQGRVREATAEITVSGDLPTIGDPTIGVVTGAALPSTSKASAVRARVSWPAATDATTAITAYEVETSVDGGPWVSRATYGATVRSTFRSLSQGHVHRFRVRAVDSAGNRSAWAIGAPMRLLLYQETSAFASFSGSWTRVGSSTASAAATRYSTRATAWARFTFTGSAIGIVAPLSSRRGSAHVYVDGVHVRTVSFYSSTARSRVLVFNHVFATPGSHRIELRLVGTSGRPRVDVDAFLVTR